MAPDEGAGIRVLRLAVGRLLDAGRQVSLLTHHAHPLPVCIVGSETPGHIPALPIRADVKVATEQTSVAIRGPQTEAQLRALYSRAAIYAALLFWTFICLFPIYWTVTTSFKSAVDVTQAHLIPWVDFQPDWKGWRSLGLSPDTLFGTSTARSEFVNRFVNNLRQGHNVINALMTPLQRELMSRLQGLMALAEGYSNHVMNHVGRDLLPNFELIHQRVEQRQRLQRDDRHREPERHRHRGRQRGRRLFGRRSGRRSTAIRPV